MKPEELKEGMKVHYSPTVGEKENGIVKSFNEHVAFVVYKCANNWENYREYTGQATDFNDLRLGWVASPELKAKREKQLDDAWDDLGNTLREMGNEEPGW